VGFDVSYHPISVQQMHDWYFEPLKDASLGISLCESLSINDLYKDKYLDLLEHGRQVTKDGVFNKTHGFYIAVAQGIFAKYHYVRGGAISFAADVFSPFAAAWEQIAPAEFHTAVMEPPIGENYSSGLFIPPDKIETVLSAVQNDPALKAAIADILPGPHLDIFVKALESARDQSVGLLEATEVVEPNPMDLNGSTSYSNLFNCDTAGPLLYRETSLAQFAQIEKAQGMEPGTIADSNPERVVIETDRDQAPEKPKGFLARLFGRNK